MSDITDRLDRLESVVEDQQETIERQRERIEQQAEVIDDLRSDDGAPTVESRDRGGEGNTSVSRRGAMKAAGLVGLLGAGAGAVTAGPTIGEPGNQVETLYAQGLAGDLTGGTTVTDLAGAGLTVSNGSLGPSLSSDLTLSDGEVAVDVGPGDVGAAPDGHDNSAHTQTYAVDGDLQPPETHGNGAHSETYATTGAVPDSPSDIGAASDNHGNGAHSTNFVSSLSGGTGIAQSSLGDGDTVSVDWSDANDLDGSGNVSGPGVSGGRYISINGSQVDFSPPAEWNDSGGDNTITGGSNQNVVICGGNNNTIDSNAGSNSFTDNSFIGAGVLNTIGDPYGGIVAGIGNEISFIQSFVGAGGNNTAASSYSGIVAGEDNTTEALRAAVVAGENNTASSDDEVITSAGEEISGCATIVGGYDNRTEATCAGVLNGINNRAAGVASTVPGGQDNEARGDFSLAAGNSATATADGAVVLGDATDESFTPEGPGLHAQMEAYAPEMNRVVSEERQAGAEQIDAEAIVDSLLDIAVEDWGDGLGIDPAAFNDAFDLDGGDTLGSLDVDAALVAAVQALAERNRKLSETVARLDRETDD